MIKLQIIDKMEFKIEPKNYPKAYFLRLNKDPIAFVSSKQII